MLHDIDIVKLMFGLKIQQLRKERKLSYQQLSDRTGLAISYLHNIEKGKKYPKADKIMALAKALETDYNYLVSLEPDKKLKPIFDLLQSDFVKIFPMDLFGVSTSKLIELLSEAPDKMNAFMSTVIKIIRNYHVQGEDFYKAALRSYQDMHHNYFGELEDAVRAFKAEKKLKDIQRFTTDQLEQILDREFNIRVDRSYLTKGGPIKQVRSFFAKDHNTLYINNILASSQQNFLLAKEIGFQWLKLKDRPYETRMIKVDSFDKLLNNFKASYFSDALLMGEEDMVREVWEMSGWETWDSERFLELLDKYDVTPEMLLQRFANILPKHFNIQDLFFLRFYTGADMKKYVMTKEMHLSQLHTPHANLLDEHYCRRWISINLIQRLRARQSMEGDLGPMAGAQISHYVTTDNSYLCVTVAKPTILDELKSVSVTIGLLINDDLKKLFPFIDQDSKLGAKKVHTTCERCPIQDCGARAVPPIALQYANEQKKIEKALKELASIQVPG